MILPGSTTAEPRSWPGPGGLGHGRPKADAGSSGSASAGGKIALGPKGLGDSPMKTISGSPRIQARSCEDCFACRRFSFRGELGVGSRLEGGYRLRRQAKQSGKGWRWFCQRFPAAERLPGAAQGSASAGAQVVVGSSSSGRQHALGEKNATTSGTGGGPGHLSQQ